MSKRLFLTIGAVVACTAPGSTFAQTAAATDSADFAGLEEVVVTAQRREENLQKAAVAVTAITAEELVNNGVTEAQALNNLVPALSIAATAGSATQVSIRGVGNFAGNAFAEQAVAMNLDGVYLARPAGVSGLFYDIERVEVLKGPQGTLYGRNATAGAVNIVTKKPTREFGGEGSVEVGNYNLRRGFGALNVPLSDSVAMRAAFQVSKRDGYLSDGYDDDDGTAGRLSFKFDPTADLSLLLTGDYFDQSGMGSAAVITPYANPGDPYTGPSTSSGNTIFNLAGLPPIGDDGFLDNKYWGVTGSLDWQNSAGTLTIIPAYRSTKLNYLHYASGFPVSDTEDDKQKSLEVRFASNDEGALRIALVFIGVIAMSVMDKSVLRPLAATQRGVIGGQVLDMQAKAQAVFSVLVWTAVIIVGRMIAYLSDV